MAECGREFHVTTDDGKEYVAYLKQGEISVSPGFVSTQSERNMDDTSISGSLLEKNIPTQSIVRFAEKARMTASQPGVAPANISQIGVEAALKRGVGTFQNMFTRKDTDKNAAAVEAAAREAVKSANTNIEASAVQRELAEGAGPTIPRNTSKNEHRETMRRNMNKKKGSSAKNSAIRERLTAARTAAQEKMNRNAIAAERQVALQNRQAVANALGSASRAANAQQNARNAARLAAEAEQAKMNRNAIAAEAQRSLQNRQAVANTLGSASRNANAQQNAINAARMTAEAEQAKMNRNAIAAEAERSRRTMNEKRDRDALLHTMLQRKKANADSRAAANAAANAAAGWNTIPTIPLIEPSNQPTGLLEETANAIPSKKEKAAFPPMLPRSVTRKGAKASTNGQVPTTTNSPNALTEKLQNARMKYLTRKQAGRYTPTPNIPSYFPPLPAKTPNTIQEFSGRTLANAATVPTPMGASPPPPPDTRNRAYAFGQGNVFPNY